MLPNHGYCGLSVEVYFAGGQRAGGRRGRGGR